MINAAILEKHAELAADLWLRRSYAVIAPNYDLRDLAALDARVEANLDALYLAGEAGLEVCVERAHTSGAEGVFTVAWLAQRLGREQQLDALLESVAADPQLRPGLASGLSFAAAPAVSQLLVRWQSSREPTLQTLTLQLASELRERALPCLEGEWSLDSAAWLCAAARAVTYSGLVDQLPQVYPLLQHAALDVRVEAALAIVRLRGALRAPALALLDEIARLPKHPRSRLALTLGLRARDNDATAQYEPLQGGLEPLRRHLALAALGTADSVQRLVEDCRDPALARSAGYAIALITGVDLAFADLEREPPPPAIAERADTADAAEQNDSPEPESDAEPPALDEPDPSEDADEPDPERIAAWWLRERARFDAAQRYLGGLPVQVNALRKLLREGRQPVRNQAAWELGLRDHAPLFNTALPASQQRARL